ncbi:M13 family metallopeptidase [Gaetbulibacter aestuarii]|uniref:M13 family metallopeptidase n=1 Tax=Gaetbulibacter aestuarii TaxID=1502358 RepID=A0ABW7MW54_9FLAO
MKKRIYYSLTSTVLLLFIACQSNQKKDALSGMGEDPLASHIDSTYSPKTDFFMFANNTWLKNHPIKPTERSNGIFVTIQDTVNAAIKDICIKASDADAPTGSNSQKIGDFYASGMDTLAIAKLGYQPIQGELDRINRVKNLKELTEEIAHLNQIGVRPLFSFYVGTDDKNSEQNAINLYQGGLGLRQRSYYFNTDSRTKNIREKYQQHLTSMFGLLGQDSLEAQTSSQTVFKIETDLAEVSKKLEDLRDPYENYHKIAFKDLSENYKNIYWKDLFDTWGLKRVDSVIVGQPEFYKGLGTILEKYHIDAWKLYLKWNLINAFADNLSPDFENEHFNFYSTTLRGVMQQKPRWEIMVRETNRNLGELIGQIYVKDYLPPNTKAKLKEIGENIRTVFAKHIKALDWMSPETKEKALSKLSKIYMKVGYPDTWKDMSSVAINKDSYLQNIINVNTWEFNRMINKFGKPVDRSEWNMYPQTYNAYYSPSFNEIVVPACNIIVPGYEGRLPDDAILYGIIGGSTFGHEITHGFDDNGSQYDENGNLRNWWTKEDREKFEAKTKLIIEQYNNYVVLDSLHINGEATQGENIADLGGTTMGYEAFKKTPQYQNNEMIAGLNPSQRFFLGYAFAWMMNQRDASLANRIMTDVHSPYKFRVNGVVSNLEPFYKTFNVEQGDAMFRPDSIRVKIW